MLRRLSGRRHMVHTGLALVLPEECRTADQSRTLTAIVSSTVTFHQLDDEQIAAYVQTGEPLNKAGAYGLQGSGSQLVASLSGCFTNVVGLPLCAIAKLLTAATGQPVLCPADAGCRAAGADDQRLRARRHHAQVAREMFLRHDLITPTLGGHAWFEKPALLYWMMIASFHLFGISEWAARLGELPPRPDA